MGRSNRQDKRILEGIHHERILPETFEMLERSSTVLDNRKVGIQGNTIQNARAIDLESEGYFPDPGKCMTLSEHLTEDSTWDNCQAQSSSDHAWIPPNNTSWMSWNDQGYESVYMEFQRQLQQQRSEIESLKKFIEDLEQNTRKGAQQHSTPSWLTVHRVKYNDSERLYEDCPQRTWTGGQYRIEGLHHIPRLRKFVKERQGEETAFLVLHSYDSIEQLDCEPPDHNGSEPISRFRTATQVQFLSPLLAGAFEVLLKKNETLLNNVDFEDVLDLYDDLDSDNGEACDMVTNMDTVFYHFRQVFENALTQFENAERQVLKSLIDFLTEEFGSKHHEIERSFGEGIVTPTTLKYLFRREDIVIICEGKGVYGAKLKSFAEKPDHKMLIDAESYAFDGKFNTVRKDSKLQLPKSMREKQPTKITYLPCYPLSFADAEVKERLMNRGHTFWRCRVLAYVAYNGPNTKQDTNYVSIMIFHIIISTY